MTIPTCSQPRRVPQTSRTYLSLGWYHTQWLSQSLTLHTIRSVVSHGAKWRLADAVRRVYRAVFLSQMSKRNVFAARCYTQSVELTRQVVRLSVCPLALWRWGIWSRIGRNNSKIISWLFSVGSSCSTAPNITDLLQVDHPLIIPGGIEVG